MTSFDTLGKKDSAGDVIGLLPAPLCDAGSSPSAS